MSNTLYIGWVCPLCGRANAPWVEQCKCIDVVQIDKDFNKADNNHTDEPKAIQWNKLL